MNLEQKKQLSERNKRLGIKPPSNKGKHFTKEHVQKIIDAKRKNGSLYHKPETTLKIQAARKIHFDLKGRVSSVRDRLEGTSEYQSWRKQILAIGKCENCSSSENLQTHHKTPLRIFIKKYNGDVQKLKTCKELFDIKLGVALCIKCHRIEDNKLCKIYPQKNLQT